MFSATYSYPIHPAQSQPQDNMPHQKKYNRSSASSENDTEEIASFLLSLKHRSVTPEPSLAGDSAPSMSTSSSVSNNFSHPSPLRDDDPQQEQQQQTFVDKTPALMMVEQMQHQQEQTSSVNMEDFDVEALMGVGTLVLKKDRDLVPDSLFLAMSQMKPCELTQADRVGCYKSRELGFVGMACVHCAGQPGFGRYYPNSVRSLAQTTTSQTILKHVGSKCRFCPAHIRDAVNELQRQQAAREGMSSGRPRYGSRKIFFQRVWARLRGGELPEEDDDASNQSPPDLSSEANSRQSSPATSDDEDFSQNSSSKIANKRKLGLLPTQKNLMKRSLDTSPENDAKRPRV